MAFTASLLAQEDIQIMQEVKLSSATVFLCDGFKAVDGDPTQIKTTRSPFDPSGWGCDSGGLLARSSTDTNTTTTTSCVFDGDDTSAEMVGLAPTTAYKG